MTATVDLDPYPNEASDLTVVPGASTCTCSARTSAPRTGRWRPSGRGSRGGRTADLAAAVEGEKPPIEIARNRFGLHRAVNDRLKESGVELRELGPRARERLVLRTVELGGKKGKSWASRVQADDQPLNIEGCCFLEDGTLLLGLRCPVTAS